MRDVFQTHPISVGISHQKYPPLLVMRVETAAGGACWTFLNYFSGAGNSKMDHNMYIYIFWVVPLPSNSENEGL